MPSQTLLHPAARGADVVLVVTRSRLTGTVRRRCLFNLPSATLAAQRARERGDAVQLVLCRLEPLPAPEKVPAGLELEGDV